MLDSMLEELGRLDEARREAVERGTNIARAMRKELEQRHERAESAEAVLEDAWEEINDDWDEGANETLAQCIHRLRMERNDYLDKLLRLEHENTRFREALEQGERILNWARKFGQPMTMKEVKDV